MISIPLKEGHVKIYLSPKTHKDGVVGWSALCDCGIS